MKGARKYYIRGVVQGVGFRYFTYKIAQKYHITGAVRNLPDGRVEVHAEGDEAELSRFAAELSRGPRSAVVTEITTEELAASHPQDFRIE